MNITSSDAVTILQLLESIDLKTLRMHQATNVIVKLEQIIEGGQKIADTGSIQPDSNDYVYIEIVYTCNTGWVDLHNALDWVSRDRNGCIDDKNILDDIASMVGSLTPNSTNPFCGARARSYRSPVMWLRAEALGIIDQIERQCPSVVANIRSGLDTWPR